MKKSALFIAIALTFSANMALAIPLVDADPVGVSAAQLSLPGELIENISTDMTVARASVIDVDESKPVHPSKLSLQGEVIEDVLAPEDMIHSQPIERVCAR
jgi:hypothetical protein